MSTAVEPPALITRLDALTALRWWAAFAVFLFHMRNLVTFPTWMRWLVDDGHYGVTFFFVLSGFVLTWSWRREPPVRAFYWRRFARIYPLHLFALIVAVPVFYRVVAPPDQTWIKPLDWGILLLSVLVIQGWWRSSDILFSGNPAAWTLTVEAFFYALHPLLIRMIAPLRRRGALVIGAAVVAAAILIKIGAVLWPTGPLADLRQPVAHLPAFILGMLMAWAFRHGWRWRVPVVIPALMLLAWLLGSALVQRSAGDRAFAVAITPEVVTVLCALIIAASATTELRGRSRFAVWRPLVALGEWSFAFYLIHATIMYAVLELVGPQFGSLWKTAAWCAVLLGAAAAAAWAMHRFIERPMEKRLRAWQDRRLARVS